MAFSPRINFFDRPLVVTDVETTGLDVRRHEIIEIGAVMLDPVTLDLGATLDLKIKPEHPETAQVEAFAINGYTPEAWQEAIALHEAMTRYAEFTAGAVFASWNITFDWQFIEEAFRTTDVRPELDYHRIDIPSLAWLQLRAKRPTSFKLSSLAPLLGIEPEPAVHRAINGAITAAKVLRALVSPVSQSTMGL